MCFYFVLSLCFLIEIYKAAMVWLIVYYIFFRVLNLWLLGFLIRSLPLLGLFILSFLIAGFLILFASATFQQLISERTSISWLYNMDWVLESKQIVFLVFQFSAIIFLHNCVYHGLWFRHGLIFMVLILSHCASVFILC